LTFPSNPLRFTIKEKDTPGSLWRFPKPDHEYGNMRPWEEGFQGKPKKEDFGMRLGDIDIKKYEGKKFSLNKLSQMIGKEMGLSPATLIRWHKSSLKKIQRSAKK